MSYGTLSSARAPAVMVGGALCAPRQRGLSPAVVSALQMEAGRLHRYIADPAASPLKTSELTGCVQYRLAEVRRLLQLHRASGA